MKSLQKIMAFVLVATMLLCMGLTVLAEPSGDETGSSSSAETTTSDETSSTESGETPATTGSITLNGTVQSKEYRLYRVFDLTYVPDSDPLKVSYTIAAAWEGFFAEGAAGAAYLVDENNEEENLNPITVNGEPKFINITEGNKAEFAKAALDWAKEATADASVTEQGTDTTETVSGLPLGYYLVYPVGATEIKAEFSSICSLTSTVPDATVVIKATYPTLDKTPDVKIEDPHAIGDIIRFTLTSKVPDMTGFEKYTFRFEDTMNDGFKFNNDVAVYINGKPLTDKKYYTIGTVTNEDGTVNPNAFSVTVKVLELVNDKVEVDGKAVQPGDKVEVKYSAIITDAALTMVAENKAKLIYSNDPNNDTETKETTEVKVSVYTVTIQINKVDGTNKTTPLSGAKFVLKNADGAFYHYVEAAGDAVAKVEWVADQKDADVVTTDAEGHASFQGLGEGTYELVEIEAPDGYNLLTAPVTVTVSKPEGELPEGNTVVTQEVKVENNTGTELPETGGIGTTIFYVLGGLLVVGAVVLLVTKKRMSVNK